ncbi:MAG: PEP-CTERM sorting domain-containing protein [Candidatus Nealsonbacteria bacterium]|nr:PEP-CTERM sorting domain-containing protein [Candidatus Nealsonbacteria bacterium]
MRELIVGLVGVVLAISGAEQAKGVVYGSLSAWGRNGSGQCAVPAGDDFVAVGGGYDYSLALRLDGSLVAWGNNPDGACDVPAGNDFAAITFGGVHGLALKKDGSLVAWGANQHGQRNTPGGNDFVAIAGGMWHNLALREDGSLAAWGRNAYGESDAPPGNDFVAIAPGYEHSVALKVDGSIVTWGGRNQFGQRDAPGGGGFVDIASGNDFSVALHGNGSLVAWGINNAGQTDVPGGNDFVAISSSVSHTLALREDGSLVAWGDNRYGQCDVPVRNDFVDFAALGKHSLVIVNPSTLFRWDNQGGGSNWATAANWDPDEVPGPTIETSIATGDTVWVYTPGQEAKSISVEDGTLNMMSSGQLTVAEDVSAATGSTIRVDGALTAASMDCEGELTGRGTITAPVTVTGDAIVSPGGGIGTLTIGGTTFEAESTLSIELSGPSSAGSYDQLAVTGALSLVSAGNVLALEWIPGGDSSSKFSGDYAIATYESQSGEFETVGGGADEYSIGEAYVAGVDYETGDQITVSLHTLLDADADLDGDVDFGDYMVLESWFGGPGDWSKGDFDLDGDIDFGDYMILEAAFGDAVPAESAAAVPEPGTIAMLLGVLLGIACYRKRLEK